jgi:hypothetical protein
MGRNGSGGGSSLYSPSTMVEEILGPFLNRSPKIPPVTAPFAQLGSGNLLWSRPSTPYTTASPAVTPQATPGRNASPDFGLPRLHQQHQQGAVFDAKAAGGARPAQLEIPEHGMSNMRSSSRGATSAPAVGGAAGMGAGFAYDGEMNVGPTGRGAAAAVAGGGGGMGSDSCGSEYDGRSWGAQQGLAGTPSSSFGTASSGVGTGSSTQSSSSYGGVHVLQPPPWSGVQQGFGAAPYGDEARGGADAVLRSPYDRQRQGFKASMRKGLMVYDQYKQRSRPVQDVNGSSAAVGSGTAQVAVAPDPMEELSRRYRNRVPMI